MVVSKFFDVANWGWFVYLGIQVFCIGFLVIAERKHPNKIVVWGFFILIFSILAFYVYLVIGISVDPSTRFRKSDFENRTVDMVEKASAASGEPPSDSKEIIEYLKKYNGPSFSAGDKVELITDGRKLYESYFDDLRNAKSFIHTELYIVKNDYIGKEYFRIMTEKVKEGVEVLILADSFGIGDGPFRAINEFVAAGGKLIELHPLDSVIFSPKLNLRNHRKLTVIDGKVGYCGGFNYGKEHLGLGYLGYWRDTTARLEGNSIASLENIFITDWEYAGGNKIDVDSGKYFTLFNEKKSDAAIQIISSGPNQKGCNNATKHQLLEMVKSAKKSICLHTPYLVPDDEFVNAIKNAIDSGVEVKFIVPNISDHPFVLYNTLYNANRFLEMGAKVYLYTGGFIHSKTMTIDDRISYVGSSNIDDRSFLLNFECNVMFYSESIGKEMREAFEEDLENCIEYTHEKFMEIRGFKKFKMRIARLFRNFA